MASGAATPSANVGPHDRPRPLPKRAPTESSPLARPEARVAGDTIDLRTSRLAELVAGLTGCEPGGALHAVRTQEGPTTGDALEVVARAMVDVDQPMPEGMRVAGFLRDEAEDADADGAADASGPAGDTTP